MNDVCLLNIIKYSDSFALENERFDLFIIVSTNMIHSVMFFRNQGLSLSLYSHNIIVVIIKIPSPSLIKPMLLCC